MVRAYAWATQEHDLTEIDFIGNESGIDKELPTDLSAFARNVIGNLRLVPGVRVDACRNNPLRTPADIGGIDIKNSEVDGSLVDTTMVTNSAALAIGSGADTSIGGISITNSRFNGTVTSTTTAVNSAVIVIGSSASARIGDIILSDSKASYNLNEATQLCFYARGANGGETVRFVDNSLDSASRNTAFIYDNAIALIALQSLTRARTLADALLSHTDVFNDGRPRNAYQGGEISLPVGWLPKGSPNSVRMPGWYDPQPIIWFEDESTRRASTGNVAWAILAPFNKAGEVDPWAETTSSPTPRRSLKTARPANLLHSMIGVSGETEAGSAGVQPAEG